MTYFETQFVILGGIFDETEEAQIQAFEHAIDLVNADKSLLVRTRLVAHSERIPPGDSFKASKKGMKKNEN